ncbi:MAG TPA: reverse transcriptase domain-containing protein, partial [Candidatus Bathyarchaeia archaeon]|nr:reverse transcriptase domain-containing protein [Candidatus Bathyarchaeia archaeon]
MLARLNRTIIDCAESMRHNGKLEQRFWTAAISTAVYIINRRPHSALPQRMSPFQAWNAKGPELTHLRTFGCDAYVHLPNQLHRKLQPRGRKVTFIGYPSNQKGYQFWDDEDQRIIVTRFTDATFDENSFTRAQPVRFNSFNFLVDEHPSSSFQAPTSTTDPMILSSELSESPSLSSSASPILELSELQPEVALSEDSSLLDLSEAQSSPPSSTSEAPESCENHEPGPPQSADQPRNRRPPGEWWKAPLAMLVQIEDKNSLRASQIVIPSSIKEALDPRNEFCKQWTRATQAEFNSLQENDTWELVKLPRGRNAIQNKWVFKVKPNDKGFVDKFKARLVVKGY